MYDRVRSSVNVFEKIESRPQICSYNMIPHESLPGKPLIGKFQSDHPDTAISAPTSTVKAQEKPPAVL